MTKRSLIVVFLVLILLLSSIGCVPADRIEEVSEEGPVSSVQSEEDVSEAVAENSLVTEVSEEEISYVKYDRNPYVTWRDDETGKETPVRLRTNHPDITQEEFSSAYTWTKEYEDAMGYLLPGADKELYDSVRDLPFYDVTKGTLILAKNEIYARHGRKFKNADIQNYFYQMDWYKGTIEPEDFKESYLNSFEQKNTQFLDEYVRRIVINGDVDYEGQTNQDVRKPAGWRQIVQNSQFQLGGEPYLDEYDSWVQDYGTYPVIDGSTVAIPMIAEFAWQHIGLSEQDVDEFCWVATTSYAYENLIYKRDSYRYIGSVSIVPKQRDILIGTEPSKDALNWAKEEGITLVTKPVCMDAFVFITHKDNPVNSLTVDQIQKIYTGQITNWKQVGGKDEPIKAYQRSQNSGSQTAMENIVMKGKKMVDPPITLITDDMEGLIEGVAAFDGSASAIGYTYKFYIDNQYKNDNVKTISVNGIAPTDGNIRSKTYPFFDYYYGVIRGGEENAVGGRFLDWMLSDEGQQCIKQAGYISLK